MNVDQFRTFPHFAKDKSLPLKRAEVKLKGAGGRRLREGGRVLGGRVRSVGSGGERIENKVKG